jgi:alpha-1,6-mannosyltransferase
MLQGPRSKFDPKYHFIHTFDYLKPRSKIASILNSEQPDLIEICDKYSLQYMGGLMRIGRLPGVRRRATVVGLTCERFDYNFETYVSRHRGCRAFVRWYMKWIYFPLCDHHIAVTAHTAEELRQASLGHKVSRSVWVAPMGVDTDTFHPSRRAANVRAGLLERCGASPQSFLVLYAGRLAPEKNLPLLFDTMTRLIRFPGTEFHLLVVGDGSLAGWMETEAQRVPGRVHLLGHFGSRERLADVMANCDVFVHPNPREPFGIAPLEAMASGLPLVCADTGGVRTYANPTVAWVAPPSAECFAGAVREAVFGGRLRHVKTGLARAVAEEYSWARACGRYFKLYDEIHALHTTGRQPSVRSAFRSTPGNWFGMEIGPSHPSSAP